VENVDIFAGPFGRRKISASEENLYPTAPHWRSTSIALFLRLHGLRRRGADSSHRPDILLALYCWTSALLSGEAGTAAAQRGVTGQ